MAEHPCTLTYYGFRLACSGHHSLSHLRVQTACLTSPLRHCRTIAHAAEHPTASTLFVTSNLRRRGRAVRCIANSPLESSKKPTHLGRVRSWRITRLSWRARILEPMTVAAPRRLHHPVFLSTPAAVIAERRPLPGRCPHGVGLMLLCDIFRATNSGVPHLMSRSTCRSAPCLSVKSIYLPRAGVAAPWHCHRRHYFPWCSDAAGGQPARMLYTETTRAHANLKNAGDGESNGYHIVGCRTD